MLITALRDLQWRRRRFVVAVVGTAMVFGLTLILTGLAHGFRVEAERVVDSLNIDTYLVPDGAEGPFMGSSRFDERETQAVADLPGVQEAIPLMYGNTIVKSEGTPANVNIYGVPTPPRIRSGRAPSAPDEMAMSISFGRSVGDEVQVGAKKLQIVGVVDKSTTLAGQANAFMTVAGAQQLMFSGQPVISAIGLRGVPDDVPDGYRIMGRKATVDDMVRPLEGARMAMSYMAILLWGVAGMIVGSLIYLSALERTRDFAVFKALGATTKLVLAGLALQAVAVAVVSAVFGGLIAVVMGPFFPMLVVVTVSAFAWLVLTAVGIGLLASLAGLRHAVAVDPVLAFGGP